MRKFITILLCMTLVVSALALFGCADNEQDKELIDNSLEHLQGLDFGGEEVSIVYVEGANGRFTERSIALDDKEDISDNVDKAVQKRNAEVEAMLGVKIVPIRGAEQFSELTGAISSSLASGSGEYDIVAGYQYYDIGLASKGWMYNLNNLAAEDADYLRLDADYWSSGYNNGLAFGNSTYWITGDLALRYLGGMYCTFVNADMYDDLLLKDYGSIYKLVRDGKWTLDMLLEMSELVYEDKDGGGETDDGDRLGFVIETSMDPIDGVAFGSAIQWTQRNEDGFSLTFRNSRTLTFGEKMAAIISSRSFYAPPGSAAANQMALFGSGNVCFTVANVYHAEVHLREMERFYVIPVPMLNEDQGGYSSGIHDGCTIFGIPHDAPDLAKSAATLEALAAKSREYVTPEYYESALKFKYTRDNEAAEMIDIMRDAAYTDFGAAWSKDLDDIVHFFRENSNNLGQINAALQKRYSKWEVSLKTLLESLELYAD